MVLYVMVSACSLLGNIGYSRLYPQKPTQHAEAETILGKEEDEQIVRPSSVYL